jgi:hypothetical protein
LYKLLRSTPYYINTIYLYVEKKTNPMEPMEPSAELSAV